MQSSVSIKKSKIGCFGVYSFCACRHGLTLLPSQEYIINVVSSSEISNLLLKTSKGASVIKNISPFSFSINSMALINKYQKLCLKQANFVRGIIYTFQKWLHTNFIQILSLALINLLTFPTFWYWQKNEYECFISHGPSTHAHTYMHAQTWVCTHM